MEVLFKMPNLEKFDAKFSSRRTKLSKLWNHKLQCSKVVLGKEPVSVPVSLCRDAVKDRDAERNEPW